MNPPTQTATSGGGGPISQLLRPHYLHPWRYPWVHVHEGNTVLERGILVQKWGDDWQWAFLYANSYFDPTGYPDIHDPMTCEVCISNRLPGIGFKFDCLDLLADIGRRVRLCRAAAIKRREQDRAYTESLQRRTRDEVLAVMRARIGNRPPPDPDMWAAERIGDTIAKTITTGPMETVWRPLKPFDGTFTTAKLIVPPWTTRSSATDAPLATYEFIDAPVTLR